MRLVAELESLDAATAAIRELRARGFEDLDAFAPYGADAIHEALGAPKSPLPWITLAAGLVGAGLAYLLMWWTRAVDYPINIGGHVDHAVPAFVPITFETMVLFAGCAAFFGGLVLAGLPRLHHPMFRVPGFDCATVDRFFVAVSSESQRDGVKALLVDLGALSVVDLDELEREEQQ